MILRNFSRVRYVTTSCSYLVHFVYVQYIHRYYITYVAPDWFKIHENSNLLSSSPYQGMFCFLGNYIIAVYQKFTKECVALRSTILKIWHVVTVISGIFFREFSRSMSYNDYLISRCFTDYHRGFQVDLTGADEKIIITEVQSLMFKRCCIQIVLTYKILSVLHQWFPRFSQMNDFLNYNMKVFSL